MNWLCYFAFSAKGKVSLLFNTSFPEFGVFSVCFSDPICYVVWILYFSNNDDEYVSCIQHLWRWLGHSYTFFAILSWLNFKLMFSFSLGFPSFVSVKAGISCQMEDEQWPFSWGYLLLKFHGCVDTSVLQNSWFHSFL